MSAIMLDEDGRPLSILGCAVPFNTPSAPIPELGNNKREIVSALAFDAVLKDIAAGRKPLPVIDAKHTTKPLLTADNAAIDLWVDSRAGLIFRVSNIAATPDAAWLVQAIGSRKLWGCSMLAGCVHDTRDTAEGYRRVSAIDSLPAITITDEGFYGDAALVVIEGQDHRTLRNHAHRDIAAGLHLAVARAHR